MMLNPFYYITLVNCGKIETKHMADYATNKKVYFNYEILEEIEAGLVLTGSETKSIRTGGAKLVGSYVSFKEDGAYVANMRISPYKFAVKDDDYSPLRLKKILLSKKQLNFLNGKSQEKGLTIVPLSVYNRGRFIKIKIGLARGKTKYDKRESIKKRETNREFRRIMKH